MKSRYRKILKLQPGIIIKIVKNGLTLALQTLKNNINRKQKQKKKQNNNNNNNKKTNPYFSPSNLRKTTVLTSWTGLPQEIMEMS